MNNVVDLNCDLGESFGPYTLGMDEEILPLISSANIACGFHASDPVTMERTVQLAEKNGVAIGAHPGLPDLVGFGRREMAVSPSEVKALVKYQIGALLSFTKEKRLHHVKPHGALYNMAAKDFVLAAHIVEAIQEVDASLLLYGLANSELIIAAKKAGLAYKQEVFADRALQADGTLVPRSKPGAMIEDEDLAVNRVCTMVQTGKVEAINGKIIEIQADTICVHGDQPKAIAFVRKINQALTERKIQIQAN